MTEAHRPRVLICNVHFAPQSYGGATVVAEAMAQELQFRLGWDVLVVTSFYDSRLVPYTLKRYAIGGIQAVGVCVPHPSLSFEQRYANSDFDKAFQQIFSSFAPDVVHVHCVQGMGASFLQLVKQAGVPCAVTIHDAWWVCERQFMVTPQHRYCHQSTIDLAICRYCVDDIDRTRLRHQRLQSLLRMADRYLFPSAFFRNLGIANGLPAESCFVNKNGIVAPGPYYAAMRQLKRRSLLRFGFVGGPGPNKGALQVLGALRALRRTDYELIIVDAAQNAGHSWKNLIDWKVPGKLRFHPAYTKNTMDNFFSEIDVLLFPSQWKESFGLTVREALRRNIWVIASDAGGVAEDCRDGVNSTIVPMTSDHRPLQAAITAALDDPRLRDFTNPEADSILLVGQQADELSQQLRDLLPAPRN
jgi:glycosyltransferase involved in cell wall biosynthesis